jgi:mycofactocin system creatininase family protein
VGDDGARRAARLADRTWVEAEHRPLLLVPLGSCEQHGPHLPLDTDTRIAVALAEAAAPRLADALVAPPIAITASGEHAGFAGTLSIGTEAMTTLLVELGRSADWSAGLVFVNGHGGNATAVSRAMRTLTAEGRAALTWWPRVHDGDAHAGLTETSLLLHLDPSVVRMHLAEPGRTEPVAELGDRLVADGVRAVSPTGVLGDPTSATAELGRHTFDDLVDQLVGAVTSWRAP